MLTRSDKPRRALLLSWHLEVESAHALNLSVAQEPHTLDMLQYACSPRVTALHTGLLNARRLVRMVTHPVVAATSNAVWSFASASQVSLLCAVLLG